MDPLCPTAQEILCQYADVLRVGSMVVNNHIIRWETNTSTKGQLQSFSVAFFNHLRHLPELCRASDEVLRQSTYWVCKAVSINYALAEVLMLVSRKAGCMCTIETEDTSGGLVTYAIEVLTDQMVHMRLCWHRKNNIVYHDPRTGSKKVKGTLSSVETVFPLPPVQSFTPVYRLHMNFKRSLLAMTCKCMRKKQNEAETLLIEDTLPSKTVTPVATAMHEDIGLDAAACSLFSPQRVFTSQAQRSAHESHQHCSPAAPCSPASRAKTACKGRPVLSGADVASAGCCRLSWKGCRRSHS